MQTSPFAEVALTPAAHFKLYFFAAVKRVIEQVSLSLGLFETTFDQFPFLVGYNEEIEALGLAELISDDAGWWCDSLREWEQRAPGHLPLRALREAAGLDHSALALLLAIGLIEEDARFGCLFESMQGSPGQHRPTVGLLSAWWRAPDDVIGVRANLRRLQELGLIQVMNPAAPRIEWVLAPSTLLWDVLRGDTQERLASWVSYQPPEGFLRLEELILPRALKQRLAIAPALLASGEAQALIVRGPQRNGRRTVLGAVARAMDVGLLAISGLSKADDERWRSVGPLAAMLNAIPFVALDPAPGEIVEFPRLDGYDGPIGIVLGKQGGVSCASAERALTITLEVPDASSRRLHWVMGLGGHEANELEAISERFRMTAGNIRRAASLAVSHAALDSRAAVTLADVQQASRALNRQALDTLAAQVDASGDWSQLAAGSQTLAELYNLETRCRHRERLVDSLSTAPGAQLNAGVRALFRGPSGTGKSLAAQLLASVLQMDLYRLDLSSVVNKYIGETEKNLNQVFSRAEELDVILLLDEGDALLTQRTEVRDSNDRYANLETNYLLQRLESFLGILIVTTNAGDRIDSAFNRRIDVVVEFRPPEAAERWAIWQLHLPPQQAVDPSLLREVAGRCSLTGGQIRNAVLHASLLALEAGGIVTSSHLESAVQREYRKTGAVCPLRPAEAAFSSRG